MGVPGLARLLSLRREAARATLAECASHAGDAAAARAEPQGTVNLTDLAQRVHAHACAARCREDGAEPSAASAAPAAPRLTLLVDTYAVLFRLFALDAAASGRGALSVCDADLTYFDAKVRWLHTLGQQQQLALVWYLDSASADTQGEQIQKQRSRAESKLSELAHLCDLLSQPHGRPARAEAAPAEQISLFPITLTSCIVSSLRAVGAQVRMCIGEADPQLAADAAAQCMPDEVIRALMRAPPTAAASPAAGPPLGSRLVYGVLSRDSDFALTRGIRYLSLDDLVLDTPAHITPTVTFVEARQTRMHTQSRKPASEAGVAAPAEGAPELEGEEKEGQEHENYNADPSTSSESDESEQPASAESAASTAPASTAPSSCPFLRSPPPSLVRAILCRPYTVASVCALLQLSPSRLSELAFLSGNDYSQRVATILTNMRAFEWRYNAQGAMLDSAAPAHALAHAFVTHAVRDGSSFELVGGVQHEPLAFPHQQLFTIARLFKWIGFLQAVDAAVGPQRPLETLEPFASIAKIRRMPQQRSAEAYAQPGSAVSEENEFVHVLRLARLAYEQPHEALARASAASSRSVCLPLQLQPSVLPWLHELIRQRRLSPHTLGVLSSRLFADSVWVENLESLDSSFAGVADRFRAQDSATRVHLLPAVSRTVRHLQHAFFLLCDLRAVVHLHRQDLEIIDTTVDLEATTPPLLPSYRALLATAAKGLQKRHGGGGPLLQLQLWQHASLAMKRDLLDALFTDMCRESNSEATGGGRTQLEWMHFRAGETAASPGAPSSSSSTGGTCDRRDGLLVLTGRWFMGHLFCAHFAARPLTVPLPQLELWCSAFLLAAILIQSVRRSIPPAGLFNLRLEVSSPADASALHRLDDVTVLTSLQATFGDIKNLLKCLDMDDRAEEVDAGAAPPPAVASPDLIAIPPAYECFHGQLFASLCQLGREAESGADLFTVAQEALLSGRLSLQIVSPEGRKTAASDMLGSDAVRSRWAGAHGAVLGSWSGEAFGAFLAHAQRAHANHAAAKAKAQAEKQAAAASSAPVLPRVDPSLHLTEAELAPLDYPGCPFTRYRSLVRLPIDRHAACIMSHISSSPFVIVRGATGSGKSSRIPGLILRHWYSRQETARRSKLRAQCQQQFKDARVPAIRSHPLIIVTQPRRLAAITLCKRVADELGERLGDSCGYAVGQDSQRGDRTRLLFVTTGWLYVKLMHHPTFLHECSHVLLDEIHERSSDADILAVLLQSILRVRLLEDASRGKAFPLMAVPRLILMSATFSADQFVQYFAPVYRALPAFETLGLGSPVPEVEILVNTHPTEIRWIDEALRAPVLLQHSEQIRHIYELPLRPADILSNATGGSTGGLRSKSDVMNKFVSWLAAALSICHSHDDTTNTILVFLPGVHEIESCAGVMTDRYEELYLEAQKRGDNDETLALQPYANVDIVILHSLVDDQLGVFAPRPAGRTVVILATNIAESSVTIPNCRYVIDWGTRKECVYNDRFQCDQLVKTFISRASAKQRAGRTGRVCPGTVFRLYTRKHHEGVMEEYDVPELLRVSLATVVLSFQCRAQPAPGDQHRVSPEDQLLIRECQLDDVRLLLSRCIQPPSGESIDLAFQTLVAEAAIEPVDIKGVVKAQKEQVRAMKEQNPGLSAAALKLQLATTVKREVFRTARVTQLGRFFASMPLFAFSLSRLVALGVLFGERMLPATVVLACALSMQDVFVLPSPLIIADTVQFAKVSRCATLGRLHADAGSLSDPIAVLRVVAAFMRVVHTSGGRKLGAQMEWCEKNGVHLRRLKSLLRTVCEVSKRLAPAIGNAALQHSLTLLQQFCNFSQHKSRDIAESGAAELDEATSAEVEPDDAAQSTAGDELLSSQRLFSMHDSEVDRSFNDLHHLDAQPAGVEGSAGPAPAPASASAHPPTVLPVLSKFHYHLLQLDSSSELLLKLLLLVALRRHLLMAKPKLARVSVAAKPSASSASGGSSASYSLDAARAARAHPLHCLSMTVAKALEGRTDLTTVYPELQPFHGAVRSCSSHGASASFQFHDDPAARLPRLGLDVFSASARATGWHSVLALPAHRMLMAMARLFARAGSGPLLKLTPITTVKGTKPLPLECSQSQICGEPLKWTRVYDGLPARTDDHSIMNQLRMLTLSAQECQQERIKLHSDAAGVDIHAAHFTPQLQSYAGALSIPVYAVASSSKLIGDRSLMVERVTLLPAGMVQRVGALSVALAFGGPLKLSEDKLWITAVETSRARAGDEDEEEEDGGQALLGVDSFRPMILALHPPLPSSLLPLIQRFHRALAFDEALLTRRSLSAIEWPASVGVDASSSSTAAARSRVPLTRAFESMVEQLVPPEIKARLHQAKHSAKTAAAVDAKHGAGNAAAAPDARPSRRAHAQPAVPAPNPAKASAAKMPLARPTARPAPPARDVRNANPFTALQAEDEEDEENEEDEEEAAVATDEAAMEGPRVQQPEPASTQTPASTLRSAASAAVSAPQLAPAADALSLVLSLLPADGTPVNCGVVGDALLQRTGQSVQQLIGGAWQQWCERHVSYVRYTNPDGTAEVRRVVTRAQPQPDGIDASSGTADPCLGMGAPGDARSDALQLPLRQHAEVEATSEHAQASDLPPVSAAPVHSPSSGGAVPLRSTLIAPEWAARDAELYILRALRRDPKLPGIHLLEVRSAGKKHSEHADWFKQVLRVMTNDPRLKQVPSDHGGFYFRAATEADAAAAALPANWCQPCVEEILARVQREDTLSAADAFAIIGQHAEAQPQLGVTEAAWRSGVLRALQEQARVMVKGKGMATVLRAANRTDDWRSAAAPSAQPPPMSDSDVLSLVLSLLPADGTPVNCGVVGAQLLKRAGRTVKQLTGVAWPQWYKRHAQHLRFSNTNGTTEVRRVICRTQSQHSSGGTASPSHLDVEQGMHGAGDGLSEGLQRLTLSEHSQPAESKAHAAASSSVAPAPAARFTPECAASDAERFTLITLSRPPSLRGLHLVQGTAAAEKHARYAEWLQEVMRIMRSDPRLTHAPDGTGGFYFQAATQAQPDAAAAAAPAAPDSRATAAVGEAPISLQHAFNPAAPGAVSQPSAAAGTSTSAAASQNAAAPAASRGAPVLPLPPADLLRLVLSSLPSDGTPMKNEVLALAVQQRSGCVGFRQLAGMSLKEWATAQKDIEWTGRTLRRKRTDAESTPAPSAAPASTSPRPAAAPAQSARVDLVALIRSMLPPDGTPVNCGTIGAQLRQRTGFTVQVLSGVSWRQWFEQHPQHFVFTVTGGRTEVCRTVPTRAAAAHAGASLSAAPAACALPLAPAELARRVRALVPADGSPILCSTLFTELLRTAGVPFKQLAGRSCEQWCASQTEFTFTNAHGKKTLRRKEPTDAASREKHAAAAAEAAASVKLEATRASVRPAGSSDAVPATVAPSAAAAPASSYPVIPSTVLLALIRLMLPADGSRISCSTLCTQLQLHTGFSFQQLAGVSCGEWCASQTEFNVTGTNGYEALSAKRKPTTSEGGGSQSHAATPAIPRDGRPAASLASVSHAASAAGYVPAAVTQRLREGCAHLSPASPVATPSDSHRSTQDRVQPALPAHASSSAVAPVAHQPCAGSAHQRADASFLTHVVHASATRAPPPIVASSWANSSPAAASSWSSAATPDSDSGDDQRSSSPSEPRPGCIVS